MICLGYRVGSRESWIQMGLWSSWGLSLNPVTAPSWPAVGDPHTPGNFFREECPPPPSPPPRQRPALQDVTTAGLLANALKETETRRGVSALGPLAKLTVRVGLPCTKPVHSGWAGGSWCKHPRP